MASLSFGPPNWRSFQWVQPNRSTPDVALPAEAMYEALLAPTPCRSRRRLRYRCQREERPGGRACRRRATERRAARGSPLKLAQNMEASLALRVTSSLTSPAEPWRPGARRSTATRRTGRTESLSFTHRLIAWALVQAAGSSRCMGTSASPERRRSSRPYLEHVNLGLAVDVERKRRMVPVKQADTPILAAARPWWRRPATDPPDAGRFRRHHH